MVKTELVYHQREFYEPTPNAIKTIPVVFRQCVV